MTEHMKSLISLPELINSASTIAADARTRQDETERTRTLPPATIAALKDSGLMRVRQPRRFGGLGLSAVDHYRLTETLARGCASTGWVYAVLAGHADDIASQFPLQAQEEVWNDMPDALASSSFFPNGWAEPLDDSYRLNGEFGFSSGCDHAEWAIVGSIAGDLPNGPGPCLFLVPMRDLTVRDTWRTRGLAGTGSRTLVADGVRVPRHRLAPFPMMVGSTAPFALAAVLVGAARGLLDAFTNHLRTKHPKDSTRPVGGEHLQTVVGECWGDIDTAWRLIEADVPDTELHLGRGPLPREVIVRNRAHNALITRLVISAIERIHAASGSAMIFQDTLLSRFYHDIKVGAQHASLQPHGAARDAGFMLLNPDHEWSYPLPA